SRPWRICPERRSSRPEWGGVRRARRPAPYGIRRGAGRCLTHLSEGEIMTVPNSPSAAPAPQLPPPVPPVSGTAASKKHNVPALIAMIVAIVGFLFACIPGALIVGWILLPIAFVLSIVSLFLKGDRKWMGV